MGYIILIISAIFVSNIVLAQFLGICPFLGVSKKVSTAVGMTGAVTFVMILATLVTYIVQVTILTPLNIEFMQTITFILIIAALVQMVEIILKKVSPSLYHGLGGFPAFNYNQLCRIGCRYYGYPEKLYITLIHRICRSYSNRFRFGSHHLCRNTGTTRVNRSSQRHERLPDRIDYSRTISNGLYGLLRYCLKVKNKRKSLFINNFFTEYFYKKHICPGFFPGHLFYL